jgi:hypothetical protein
MQRQELLTRIIKPNQLSSSTLFVDIFVITTIHTRPDPSSWPYFLSATYPSILCITETPSRLMRSTIHYIPSIHAWQWNTLHQAPFR